MEVGDEVVQSQGPCKGKVFIITEVDGNMLRVRLKKPRPPYSGQPEWSHKTNYISA